MQGRFGHPPSCRTQEAKEVSFPKSHNLVVSDHALERFRERTGSTASDITIANTLRSAVENGQEMELHERYRIIELLNHGFKHARFFKYGASLVVVTDNIITTIHNQQAYRWHKKKP